MAEFQGGQNAGAYLGVQAQRPPEVILSEVAPTTNQRRFRIGTLWVDRSSNQSYQLTNVVAGSATWTLLGPGASDVDTLTGDSGGAISPAGGNITLAGGTNITSAGAGNTVTFNLDNAITVSTSVTSASFFTSDAAAGLTISGNDIDADGTDANIPITVTPKGTGNFVIDSGNLVLGAVATQLQMNGGAATDFIGEATLTAGTVTIANTNIAANDRILLSRRDINASTALGSLTYSISAATSFTITAVQAGTPASTETNDTSIISYVIIRQN